MRHTCLDPTQGLRKIRETGESIGVPIRVYGPETHITAVVPMALGLVDGATVPEFDQVSEPVRNHDLLPLKLSHVWSRSGSTLTADLMQVRPRFGRRLVLSAAYPQTGFTLQPQRV